MWGNRIRSQKHFGNRKRRELPHVPVLELLEELEADKTADDERPHRVEEKMVPAELVPDLLVRSLGSFNSISERLRTQQKNDAGRSGRVGARSTLRNQSGAGFTHCGLEISEDSHYARGVGARLPPIECEGVRFNLKMTWAPQKNAAGRSGRVAACSTLWKDVWKITVQEQLAISLARAFRQGAIAYGGYSML
ncbi:hypothetical protein FN846DRAFT_893454 [Sphaerosporella brunnea]|uniref:Uncharacterized protein n=1 Tax=Sphaerosporella brunnea TaxID=1250544 RepID=A0A5J5EKS1_9PEZI|nr:hypothetical protein FN846DRAFT_893454 [Sphaerosporella brunnea]